MRAVAAMAMADLCDGGLTPMVEPTHLIDTLLRLNSNWNELAEESETLIAGS